MTAEFPDKLQCLFEPHRYKVLFGGRGGAKSWGIARALLILGAQRKLRILCAREIQKSIADSVHTLLRDQIAGLALAGRYEVLETAIRGTNGTEFLFAGLRHNVASLKSVEGCDIVWVEEAQTVSKDSWDTLIPTVRKDSSEIWLSFNPDLETDDTYKRFVLNPPPGALVVRVGWRDNPWFPDVLRIEKDHLEASDPAAYRHVWEGEPKSAIQGAIFAGEMEQAQLSGRITEVPVDRTRPVHTFWDLGYGDSTAIWFAQSLPDGRYRVIDYLENHGKTIEWYVIQLQNKGYLYGQDWVPHDAVDTIIHAKLGADKTRSIEQLMRNAGRNVRITPKLLVHDRINAARTVFSSCWFDATKCADGLQSLRHYQWAPDTVSGVQAIKPLHNWASHGADAFCGLAVSLKTPPLEKKPQSQPEEEYSWMA